MNKVIDYNVAIAEVEEEISKLWKDYKGTSITYEHFILRKVYEQLVFPEAGQFDFFKDISHIIIAKLRHDLEKATKKIPVRATEVTSIDTNRRWLVNIALEQWVEIDAMLIKYYAPEDKFVEKELELHKNTLRLYLLDCLLKGDFS